MRGMQYTIQRLDDGNQAQWENNEGIAQTILFDTPEEAEEMITLFPDFFNEPKNLEIKKGIYFIDESINYKDLKEDKEFQAVINKEETNHG
jgi:hypothetical protein